MIERIHHLTSAPSKAHAKAPTTKPRLERHKGQGPFHALLVPGLVPDAAETFLRQLPLLRRFGDVTTLTYPYEDFQLNDVVRRIEEHIIGCALEKRRPLLVGVSVGASFVLETLRRQRTSGQVANLAGIVLISPLSHTDDLAPLLKRLWKPIVADDDRNQQALEKGRRFFQQLASRSAGKGQMPKGWKGLLAALTPQGWMEIAEGSIRKRIQGTLDAIPATGAIARCRALRELPGLDSDDKAKEPLSHSPTLILWGSRETHTLDMDGPGARRLSRPDLAETLFPCSELHWIYTKTGEPVPHASLLKHDKAFNKPLKRFLKRLI